MSVYFYHRINIYVCTYVCMFKILKRYVGKYRAESRVEYCRIMSNYCRNYEQSLRINCHILRLTAWQTVRAIHILYIYMYVCASEYINIVGWLNISNVIECKRKYTIKVAIRKRILKYLIIFFFNSVKLQLYWYWDLF